MVNLKKIQKQVLLACSVVIGVTPVLMKSGLLKKKKHQRQLSLHNLTGNWLTQDQSFLLHIHNEPKLTMNGKNLDLTLIKSNEQELFLQDRYGYGITIRQVDANTLELFDEAEEKNYLFSKKKK